MADVFISYKSERRRAAAHLADVIRAHGFSVWFDYQLFRGEDFSVQIMQQLFDAKVVVTLWCDLSVRSPWVLVESLVARHQNKFVPALIADCKPPPEFQNDQYIDLKEDWADAKPVADFSPKLIDDIERLTGRDSLQDRRKMRQLHDAWQLHKSQPLSFYVGEVEPGHHRREAGQASADIFKPEALGPKQSETVAAQYWRTAKDSLDKRRLEILIGQFPDTFEAMQARDHCLQLKDWDEVDQTSIPAVETFLGTDPFPALADSVAKRLGELKSAENERRRSEEEEKRRAEEARRKAEISVGRDEIPPTHPKTIPKGGNLSRPTATPSLSISNTEKQISELRIRLALTGHEGQVYSVAFSPDGKTALTGSSDKTARLWSLETGETLLTLKGHKWTVQSAQFNPNGRIALTGSWDKTVRLWSLETGETLLTLKGHEWTVQSAQFSPDGKIALTGSSDNTARLWSLETGKTLLTLKGHESDVWSAQFSPDGKTALTGSSDNTARLWSLETGDTLRTLKGHDGAVRSVQFSPDGKTALTGSFDDTARLWSVETGETLAILKGHEGSVLSAQFSPDGKTVLTGSGDKTARLWSVETGDTLAILKGHTDLVMSVAFSADGKTALTGSEDNTAQLWDVIYE